MPHKHTFVGKLCSPGKSHQPQPSLSGFSPSPPPPSLPRIRSAAFVAPPSSRLSTGITAHRTSRAAITGAALGARQPRGLPLSMAGDAGEVDPEILKKVQDIVVSQLSVEPSQVLPEASFTQDLGADSLDTVELIMALEEGFDVSPCRCCFCFSCCCCRFCLQCSCGLCVRSGAP